MFYDSENNHIEDTSELWERYQQHLNNGKGVFAEEEIVLIFDELDKQQKWKEALDFVNNMLLFYPQSATLKIQKADVLISLDDIDASQELLNSFLEYETHDVDYYLLQTEIEVICQREEQAKQWIDNAEIYLTKEENIEYLEELIEVLPTYEQKTLIFHCLSKRFDIQESTPSLQLLHLFIEYAEKERKYQELKSVCQRIIAKNPYMVDAWFGLGRGYLASKKYDQAVDAFLYVSAIDEQYPSISHFIAICYMKNKQYEAARDALLDYLDTNANDVSTLCSIGLCCLKMKAYSLAKYYYEKALDEKPTSHHILADIAQVYIEEKKYAKAIRTLQKAILFENTISRYHYLVGHCQYKLSQYHVAIKGYALALSISIGKKEYWEGLLKSFIQIGDFEQVQTMSLHALKHSKKDYFLYYLAYSEYKTGKKLPAQHTLKRAIQSSPKKFKNLAMIMPLHQIKEISKNKRS